jgi:hypothetical protein
MPDAMNMHDIIRTYQPGERVSDGAGGYTYTHVNAKTIYANVEPMRGNLGLYFQQLTGVKGFNVHIRTDYGRMPQIGHKVEYDGIYGKFTMLIHDIDIGKTRTKLICKSENRV